MKRLSALAPQVKTVLGAHNIPVAPPEVLGRLVDAIEAVRAGQGEVKSEGPGKAMHTLGGFKFLMAEARKGTE